jgi:hypothetical protein
VYDMAEATLFLFLLERALHAYSEKTEDIIPRRCGASQQRRELLSCSLDHDNAVEPHDVGSMSAASNRLASSAEFTHRDQTLSSATYVTV